MQTKLPAVAGPVERGVRPPAGSRHADEETRLVVAHYKAEFARLATLANNCARSPSTDPADFRADLEALVLHAQRFLAA